MADAQQLKTPQRRFTRAEVDELLASARSNNAIEGMRTTDVEHAAVREAAHMKYRGVSADSPDPE